MKKSFALTVLRDFVSLFYPDYCLGCSSHLVRGEQLVCTRCMMLMPQTNYHLSPENPLKRRLVGRLPVEHASAFFVFSKSGRIQKILHALKYKGESEVGVMLGKVYGDKLRVLNPDFNVIVPVPLHPKRERRRGYNQSGKFAEGLSQALSIPAAENILYRKVMTETQTKKSKLNRWENVNDIFDIRGEGNGLTGMHVLLVDDVITTGATIEACGAALVKHGARSISVACIAVA